MLRVTPPYLEHRVCLKNVLLTKGYGEEILYEYVLWNLCG